MEPSNASHPGAAASIGNVFIRVPQLQAPVVVLLRPGMTVAELRGAFLAVYRERMGEQPTPSSSVVTDCRLVCRGKELLDIMHLEGIVRPGDHLHAIVRETEAALPLSQRQQEQHEASLAPTRESLRRGAQNIVDEISRIMRARDEERQRQLQQNDDRVATALRARLQHPHAQPNAAQGNNTAAPSPGSHQQAMRLTQPDASIGTDGSNIEGASADPTQYGGVDGMTEFQALDDNLFDGSRAGDTLSSTNLLRMVSTITEAPAVFLFGLCSGYFLGFLIVLFVFARDLRLDFRYGGAVGLALNVFLGMMLPHTSVVAFRSPH